MVFCSLWTDTTVRSIQTLICRVTCALEQLWFPSQRLHWSLNPTFSLQRHPNCSALLRSSPVLHAMPIFGFCQALCLPSITRKEGRKENIKACDFDAGSVATCITRRREKTTCCCLGIDINWPFQSLPNSELLSALPLFIYMLLKAIHIQHAECSRYACVMWLEAPHYSKQYPLKIKTSIFWPNNWNETWMRDYQDAH